MTSKEFDTDVKNKAVDVELRFKDQALWDMYVEANCEDAYGRYIIDTAEYWMKLMQPQLDAGKEIKDIAHPSFVELNPDYLSGFQYGCVIKVIYDCWEYGETLRVWHTLEVQLREESERANES